MNQKKLFHEKYIEPELVNIYNKVVEDSRTIISLKRIDYLVNVKRVVTLTCKPVLFFGCPMGGNGKQAAGLVKISYFLMIKVEQLDVAYFPRYHGTTDHTRLFSRVRQSDRELKIPCGCGFVVW